MFRELVSQPVLAKFLNVSPSTVKQWESGEKHPNGATIRLLELIDCYGLKIIKCRNEYKNSAINSGYK